MLSRASIAPVAESLNLGRVSDEVLDFVAGAIEFHLNDLLQETRKIARQSKRSRILIHDLNFALELHRAEALYGYTAPSTTSGKVSDNVDLIQAARSPLPVCPLEVQCSMHWLAIDGIQPEIRMNVPRRRRKYSKAKDDNKKGVRGGGEATRADEPDASPDLKHELCEEMHGFLRRIQMAMKVNDSYKQMRIIRSLSADPGLQELVPYLSQLISSRISILVRSEAFGSILNELYFLVHLAGCLLVNRHFHYVDVYLHQILPALMTVVLHSGYTLPGEEGHWGLRLYASQLLALICQRFGKDYVQLEPRVMLAFSEALGANPPPPMTTQYGAIVGATCLGPLVVESLLVANATSWKTEYDAASSAAATEKGVQIPNTSPSRCQEALLLAIGAYIRFCQTRMRVMRVQLQNLQPTTVTGLSQRIYHNLNDLMDAFGEQLIPFVGVEDTIQSFNLVALHL